MDQVILVDEQDNEIGAMEKMEAHRSGILHRAFSVVLFNSKGELLLQQRSKNKYHSANLWTNTCCSHPQPGESVALAAGRRLKEEMGIDLQPEFIYKFIYRANLDHNLVEHELDHVLIGQFEGKPNMNVREVQGWKFLSLARLKEDVKLHPERYTHWFKLILDHPEFNACFPN